MEIIAVIITLLVIIWMIKRFKAVFIRNEELRRKEEFEAMIQDVLDEDQRNYAERIALSRRNAYLGGAK